MVLKSLSNLFAYIHISHLHPQNFSHTFTYTCMMYAYFHFLVLLLAYPSFLYGVFFFLFFFSVFMSIKILKQVLQVTNWRNVYCFALENGTKISLSSSERTNERTKRHASTNAPSRNIDLKMQSVKVRPFPFYDFKPDPDLLPIKTRILLFFLLYSLLFYYFHWIIGSKMKLKIVCHLVT